MRIYAKHSPMFKNPDPNLKAEDKNTYIRVSPGFHTVPDWVRQDATFISGVKAGIIEVIETKAAEKVVESKKAGK